MLNLVEILDEEQKPSPCAHGNIVAGHACYCHSEQADAPRKCPIWRHHGEARIEWKRGDWNDAVDACPYFEPAQPQEAAL